jgi:hypothetical protein
VREKRAGCRVLAPFFLWPGSGLDLSLLRLPNIALGDELDTLFQNRGSQGANSRFRTENLEARRQAARRTFGVLRVGGDTQMYAKVVSLALAAALARGASLFFWLTADSSGRQPLGWNIKERIGHALR